LIGESEMTSLLSGPQQFAWTAPDIILPSADLSGTID